MTDSQSSPRKTQSVTIIADKTALWCVSVSLCSLHRAAWEDVGLLLWDTFTDPTVSVRWARWFLRGVRRRAGGAFQSNTCLQTAERGGGSFLPRVDQSKHTNEALIGLFWSWLPAPSFTSPAQACASSCWERKIKNLWHTNTPILYTSALSFQRDTQRKKSDLHRPRSL